MVKNVEVKNNRKKLGDKKEPKSIDTKEDLLNLLKGITPKNEVSHDDIEVFSIDLPKDEVLKKGLILIYYEIF